MTLTSMASAMRIVTTMRKEKMIASKDKEWRDNKKSKCRIERYIRALILIFPNCKFIIKTIKQMNYLFQ